MEILRELARCLPSWYEENKRDLPWRHDREPYHVWLSEIMLQQTRAEAVKGYYSRFLEALPTVESLAQCDDDRLLKLWEGLGYYSRARNLKKAAQVIVGQYGGAFPREYDQILALPGVGEYTAGAVCSIAFDDKTPAVDGNVLRVYARVMNDATPIDEPKLKASVRTELAEVYPERAGVFTQALMELGATVCGPNRAPQCEICPCNAFCKAYRAGTAQDLPKKAPKRAKKREQYTVYILECAGEFALVQRPDSGLLARMWQFPSVQGMTDAQGAAEQAENWGMRVRDVRRQLEKNHIFTHIIWEMRGFYIEVANKNTQFCWFTPEKIAENAALPTAFRQFWEAREQ